MVRRVPMGTQPGCSAVRNSMIHKLVPVFLGLLLCLSADLRAADSLYSRSFGNPNSPAVVFLHGGPGYNAASFELSSAQRLADSGFYVIVFDQRGCGRSAKMKGAYKLDEALDDIHAIYKRYGITRARLIGHSWGGTLGIFFADRYPQYVNKLILTGSPLSYQRGFKTMLNSCKNFYAAKGDTMQHKYVMQLETMDTSSLMYASMLFMHAAKCGLYSPHAANEEATQLKARIKQDTVSKLMQNMTQAPVVGFSKTIKYTTLDMTDNLSRAVENVPVYAIYGEEDGLFDQHHLDALSHVINSPIEYVANASHHVFLDQPTGFITSVVRKLRQ
jgi:proline iminopeptidase